MQEVSKLLGGTAVGGGERRGHADARLTQLYGLMRKGYNSGARETLRTRQLNWIKQRDRDLLGRCLPGGSLNVACAVSVYEERIYDLLVQGE